MPLLSPYTVQRLQAFVVGVGSALAVAWSVKPGATEMLGRVKADRKELRSKLPDLPPLGVVR
jgi:hypothetical protein